MIILMVKMIILIILGLICHPTPPHPGVSNEGYGVPIYWAFPFNGMAFPVTGRSQLLGVPMAWRRRQAMARWRLGRRKWRGPGSGPVPDLGVPGPSPLSLPQAPGHGNSQ